MLVVCSTGCNHARCYVMAPLRPTPIVTFVKADLLTFTNVTIGGGRATCVRPIEHATKIVACL